MPRKRFNRNIIASSDAYKVHSHHRLLQENHDNNQQLFIYISNSSNLMLTKEQEKELELIAFEEGLKRKIAKFKNARKDSK
jgi:hypothetical protein